MVINSKVKVKTLIGRISPLAMAVYNSWRQMGRLPRLRHPRDYNEKVLWTAFHSDTSQWPRLADKHEVRRFVADRGLGHLLVPELGVWENADDIDFSKLRAPYVLKTTNGADTCIFVDNPLTTDFDSVRHTLKRYLKIPFGYSSGEMHYTRIKPRIVAERRLSPTGQQLDSATLIDYKVLCADGEPYAIVLMYDRQINGTTIYELKDTKWTDYTHFVKETRYYLKGTRAATPPDNLDELLDAARRLSAGFPQVRVDFYIAEGRLWFGEMTFTTHGYGWQSLTDEGLLWLGEPIRAPEK